MLDIDPSTIEITDRVERKLLPDGEYLVSLERAEDEANVVSREGATYSRVKLMVRVIEGDHSNQCLFHEPMYEHSMCGSDPKKDTAVRIGVEFLAKFHRATSCEGKITPQGLMTVGAVNLKVKTQKGRVKDTATGELYPDRNVVVDVFSIDRKSAASQTQHTPF